MDARKSWNWVQDIKDFLLIVIINITWIICRTDDIVTYVKKTKQNKTKQKPCFEELNVEILVIITLIYFLLSQLMLLICNINHSVD